MTIENHFNLCKSIIAYLLIQEYKIVLLWETQYIAPKGQMRMYFSYNATSSLGNLLMETSFIYNLIVVREFRTYNLPYS